jgi:response regulator of citrate/malate metabolism
MLGFKHSVKTLLKFKNRDNVSGHVTIVINKLNNSTKIYSSIRAAARNINVSHTTLRRYIKNNKLLKGFYIKSNVNTQKIKSSLH